MQQTQFDFPANPALSTTWHQPSNANHVYNHMATTASLDAYQQLPEQSPPLLGNGYFEVIQKSPSMYEEGEYLEFVGSEVEVNTDPDSLLQQQTNNQSLTMQPSFNYSVKNSRDKCVGPTNSTSNFINYLEQFNNCHPEVPIDNKSKTVKPINEICKTDVLASHLTANEESNEPLNNSDVCWEDFEDIDQTIFKNLIRDEALKLGVSCELQIENPEWIGNLPAYITDSSGSLFVPEDNSGAPLSGDHGEVRQTVPLLSLHCPSDDFKPEIPNCNDLSNDSGYQMMVPTTDIFGELLNTTLVQPMPVEHDPVGAATVTNVNFPQPMQGKRGRPKRTETPRTEALPHDIGRLPRESKDECKRRLRLSLSEDHSTVSPSDQEYVPDMPAGKKIKPKTQQGFPDSDCSSKSEDELKRKKNNEASKKSREKKKEREKHLEKELEILMQKKKRLELVSEQLGKAIDYVVESLKRPKN